MNTNDSRTVFGRGDAEVPTLHPDVVRELRRLGFIPEPGGDGGVSAIPLCVAVDQAQRLGAWMPVEPDASSADYDLGLEEGRRDAALFGLPSDARASAAEYARIKERVEAAIFALLPSQSELGYIHGFESVAAVRRAKEEIGQGRDRVFLFWRGSRPGNGQIALCGRHSEEWPRQLGDLRLCDLTPRLQRDLEESSIPTMHSLLRRIVSFEREEAGRMCRACYYEQTFSGLDPFHGVESVGQGHRGGRWDDGEGYLAAPRFCQPLIVEGVRRVRVREAMQGAERWFNERVGEVFKVVGCASPLSIHEAYLVELPQAVRESIPSAFVEVVE